MSNSFDVAVVGAGIVGATAANALAQLGLRVAVVDMRQPEPWTPDQWDLRVSAINRASEQIFKHINTWDTIASKRVSPFRQMQVWDEAKTGEIQFRSADCGQTHLGHIIENSAIVSSLLDSLALRENVHVFVPKKIETIENNENEIRLTLRDKDQINAKLLIGADGGRSRVRDLLAINADASSYEQKAIVAKVHTQAPHEEGAWQCFLKSGPLAFLPLTDGDCSIVWSCDQSRAAELLQLDELNFEQALAQAIDHRLGEVKLSSELRAFPLTRLHAESYIEHRTAIIGDAAHIVHPLAGLGANLGILDAASLSECVSAALDRHRDIGSQQVLRRYERWRRSENILALDLLDGFKTVFGSPLNTVRRTAAFGLSATNKIPLVKNLLMKQAMGLSGDLPIIAKS